MKKVKHSQRSQNIKFAMSLKYLQKQVRDKVDFLHADKHQTFLQVYFNPLDVKVSFQVILYLLMGMVKYSQSTQIKQVCNFFTIPQKIN